MRQRAEVFSTNTFKTWASKNVELMAADFPSKESLISAETRKQNEFLKKQYRVAGFPTVLILSADGKERGRFVGYTPGSGPSVWIEKAGDIVKP